MKQKASTSQSLPAIYLFHLPADASWAHAVERHLERILEKFKHRTFQVVLATPADETGSLQEVLSGKQGPPPAAVVVLVSKSLLKIGGEFGDADALNNARKATDARLLLVLLEKAESKFDVGLRTAARAVNTQPLSLLGSEQLEPALEGIASRIMDHARTARPKVFRSSSQETPSKAISETNAEPSNIGDALVPWVPVAASPFSPTAKTILEYAESLSRQYGERPVPVTTDLLLFALYDRGRDRLDGPCMADFLHQQIDRILAGREWTARKEFGARFADFRPASFAPQGTTMTRGLNELLQHAQEIALKVSGSTSSRTRHLVAAVLTFQRKDGFSGAQALLRELGLDIEGLKAAYLAHVKPYVPEAELPKWNALLESRSPAFAARPEFDEDGPEGDDYLNIQVEVDAFAKLIAHRRVNPPLSIGIFGDWGSGKSFFMRRIQDAVKDLAARAVAAKDMAQREVGYYRRIVQIEFNAWQYVEGNLWASLVDHIFQNLHLPPIQENQAEAEFRALKNHVAGQLNLYEEALQKINGEVDDAERRLKNATEELERIKGEQDARLQQISDVSERDYWSVLEKDFDFKGRLIALLDSVPSKDQKPKPGEESMTRAQAAAAAAEPLAALMSAAERKGWSTAALGKAVELARTAYEGLSSLVLAFKAAPPAATAAESGERDRRVKELTTKIPRPSAVLQGAKIPTLDSLDAPRARLKGLLAALRAVVDAAVAAKDQLPPGVDLKAAAALLAAPARKLWRLSHRGPRDGWTVAEAGISDESMAELRQACAELRTPLEKELGGKTHAAAALVLSELQTVEPALDRLQAALIAARAPFLAVEPIVGALRLAQTSGETTKGSLALVEQAGVLVRSAKELNNALTEAGSLLLRGKGLLAPLLQPGAWKTWIPALLVVLAGSPLGGLGLSLLVRLLPRGLGEGLQEVSASVGSLAVLLAGGTAWLRKLVVRGNEILLPLERARAVRDERIAQAKVAQQGEILRIQKELDLFRERQTAAQRKKEEAEKKVAETRAELDNLDPASLLSRFIGERAESTDYRKHLGIPALIRRDFQRLSEYIRHQNFLLESGETDEGKNGHLRINRIVLYIDDLDRCPPAKVVEVLQAVHLLLAFQLFVVIVAVDVRWLNRSLYKHYDKMLRNPQPDSQGTDKLESLIGATPQQYIEKIFQIPYWMRRIDRHGALRMVHGLLKENVDSGPQPESAASEEAKSGSASEETAHQGDQGSGGPGKPAPAEKEPLPKVPEDDPLNPKSLVITRDEIHFVEQLGELLGTSPRGVKRFVNLYRLVKAGLTWDEIDAFAAPGVCQGVLLLLAVVTGMPAVAPSFFKAVEEGAPAKPIEDLLLDASQGLPRDAAEETQRLRSWLARLATEKDGGPDLRRALQTFDRDAFKKWAGRISRYSFRSDWIEAGGITGPPPGPEAEVIAAPTPRA